MQVCVQLFDATDTIGEYMVPWADLMADRLSGTPVWVPPDEVCYVDAAAGGHPNLRVRISDLTNGVILYDQGVERFGGLYWSMAKSTLLPNVSVQVMLFLDGGIGALVHSAHTQTYLKGEKLDAVVSACEMIHTALYR